MKTKADMIKTYIICIWDTVAITQTQLDGLTVFFTSEGNSMLKQGASMRLAFSVSN